MGKLKSTSFKSKSPLHLGKKPSNPNVRPGGKTPAKVSGLGKKGVNNIFKSRNK